MKRTLIALAALCATSAVARADYPACVLRDTKGAELTYTFAVVDMKRLAEVRFEKDGVVTTYAPGKRPVWLLDWNHETDMVTLTYAKDTRYVIVFSNDQERAGGVTRSDAYMFKDGKTVVAKGGCGFVKTGKPSGARPAQGIDTEI